MCTPMVLISAGLFSVFVGTRIHGDMKGYSLDSANLTKVLLLQLVLKETILPATGRIENCEHVQAVLVTVIYCHCNRSRNFPIGHLNHQSLKAKQLLQEVHPSKPSTCFTRHRFTAAAKLFQRNVRFWAAVWAACFVIG